MNPLTATFEDYQAQYQTILPIPVREALTTIQIQVKKISRFTDEAVQAPDLVGRIAQLAVTGLAFIPVVDPYLEGAKLLCRDSRNVINLMKGMRSVDGFMNLSFQWRAIMLNVSGMVLFIVSGLSIVERFNLFPLNHMKVSLAAIPVFGILPWGGMLAFSIVGFMGMLSLLSRDKIRTLEKEETRIKTEKLPFWSEPIDLAKVEEKRNKYRDKIVHLKEEIEACEALIEEGQEVQNELKQRCDQPSRMYACQKALKELGETLQAKQESLEKYKAKARRWRYLQKKWSQINPQELDQLQQAKLDKWKKKLKKIETEKRASFLAITLNVTILARQAFVLGTLATGCGIVNLPFIVNVALDVYVAGAGMVAFFMKRSVKKTKIPSVNFEQFVPIKKQNFGTEKEGMATAAAA